jgi:hypothetical protein
MQGRFRRRPSPAFVISVIALFVALGGSSYAALKISSKNVVNNSLTTSDIKNRSLLKKDFRSGQLPRGAQGVQGAQGPSGRAGRDGFGTLAYPGSGVELLSTETTQDGFKTVCPVGTYPTGGDAYAFTNDANEDLVTHEVVKEQGFSIDTNDRPDGWYAVYKNDTGSDIVVIADAICANASPPPAPISATKAARRAKKLGG